MTPRRTKRFDGEVTGQVVLEPKAVPGLVGAFTDAPDWLCCGCETVLGLGVHELQLVDVLVECPGCHSLNESHTRSPGEPLSSSILFSPGRHLFSRTVRTDWAAFVSERALNAHRREVGLLPYSSPEPLVIPLVVNGPSLRGLIARVAALLGAEYARLKSIDQRGQRATRTPPKNRNPLMALIADVESAAEDIEKGGRFAHASLAAIAELDSLLTSIERWSNHPQWPRLAKTLKTQEATHLIALLLVASYLSEVGNAVGIVDDSRASTSMPDLFLRPTVAHRIHIEIKTLVAFQNPTEAVTHADAEELIGEELHNCAAAKKGQLTAEQTGMLVLGCSRLGEASQQVLESAALAALTASTDKRHIAAILICDLNVLRDNGMMVWPGMRVRLVQNPHYDGKHPISVAPVPNARNIDWS